MEADRKRGEHAPAVVWLPYNCLRVLTLFCQSLSVFPLSSFVIPIRINGTRPGSLLLSF
ncbi:conserved hypothetical protein [Ricinus communis]|uniref:Uncharacterized protein n=1 Tax=Ricinus communis TaxID=3988 RepID=B9T859_RICCO|nr:conserved hypothetical protein [Ricinus communis]